MLLQKPCNSLSQWDAANLDGKNSEASFKSSLSAFLNCINSSIVVATTKNGVLSLQSRNRSVVSVSPAAQFCVRNPKVFCMQKV